MDKNFKSLRSLKYTVALISAGLCWGISQPVNLYAEEAAQKFQGFNLQGYDQSGEKEWNVNGDTADINGNEIILSNVDANTFGEQKVNLTAKTGTVDQVSGKIHLQEDVVILSEDGKRLVTDSLDWNRTEDLVTTDDDVLITDKRLMATGTGMHAQPGLKNATLKEDVTVRIETEPSAGEESKTITITSDGPMVINQALSMATFDDNVYAVQNDQTLKADRMEIYFDAQMSTVKQMICTGNVEIEQGENKSFAQKAVYTAQTQKLTLSGRPKLIMLTEGDGIFAAAGN